MSKAHTKKVVYVAIFEDGERYAGYVDAECRRLRPYFKGRVGFKGRLQTKFEEQNRTWGYTAPVYRHARKHKIKEVHIVGEVTGKKQAQELKKLYACSLN